MDSYLFVRSAYDCCSFVNPFSSFLFNFRKGLRLGLNVSLFVRINLEEQEEGKKSEEIIFHSSSVVLRVHFPPFPRII